MTIQTQYKLTVLYLCAFDGLLMIVLYVKSYT